jgi:hypothetical protein
MVLLLLNSTSRAQSSSKPSLFDGFPNIINCPSTELDKAFTSNEGNLVLFSFANNTSFTGIIASATQRYSNLKSVVVRLNNLQGAILGISKRINDDNSITYIGRIINEQYADGYELKKDNAGNYFLNKIKLDNILQEHQ